MRDTSTPPSTTTIVVVVVVVVVGEVTCQIQKVHVVSDHVQVQMAKCRGRQKQASDQQKVIRKKLKEKSAWRAKVAAE